MHGEPVGDGHLRVDDLLHRVQRDRGGHGRVVDRAVADLGRQHRAWLRRELRRLPGLVERALQLLLVVAQRRLGLLHREVAPGDQRLGVELAHRAPRLDQVVHQRLGEAGVVALVVAAAAVADHVDHDVLAERLAVGERQPAHPGDGLRVVAVHVEDRRLDHPRHVGGVDAGPRLHRRGGEADLVVHHDVHGAAGAVAAQLGQVQRLGHDALAGEGRVTVDEHGQHGEAVLGLVEDVLLGADHALGHRVDALQVAGVGDQAGLDLPAGRGGERAVRAQVVLHVAGALGGLRVEVALELLEDLPVGLADDVGEHVEPAAVRHADHGLVEPVRRRPR